MADSEDQPANSSLTRFPLLPDLIEPWFDPSEPTSGLHEATEVDPISLAGMDKDCRLLYHS
jgi:hypothetical protein